MVYPHVCDRLGRVRWSGDVATFEQHDDEVADREGVIIMLFPVQRQRRVARKEVAELCFGVCASKVCQVGFCDEFFFGQCRARGVVSTWQLGRSGTDKNDATKGKCF